MPGHSDILEQPESIRKPLLGSVGLHVTVFSLLVVGHFVKSNRQPWGDLNSGGPGSISVNMVSKVPLPTRAGTVNPLANNSEFTVPEPPPKTKAQRKALPPEPDAIPLKSRKVPKRWSPESASTNQYRAQKQDRSNQLYSNTGQALVSPLVGQTGSGGVGLGTGSPFGNRFGNYSTILRQRVAEKWRTGDVDARIKSAPPVIVTFTLLRDGTVRDVRVAQRSGNAALDYSAQRAVYDASPFPPLPTEYERNDASIEFWFELRR